MIQGRKLSVGVRNKNIHDKEIIIPWETFFGTMLKSKNTSTLLNAQHYVFQKHNQFHLMIQILSPLLAALFDIFTLAKLFAM